MTGKTRYKVKPYRVSDRSLEFVLNSNLLPPFPVIRCCEHFPLANYDDDCRPKRSRTWRFQKKIEHDRRKTVGETEQRAIFPRKPFCGGHWNVRPRSSERSTRLRGRFKDMLPAKQIAATIEWSNNVVIFRW